MSSSSLSSESACPVGQHIPLGSGRGRTLRFGGALRLRVGGTDASESDDSTTVALAALRRGAMADGTERREGRAPSLSVGGLDREWDALSDERDSLCVLLRPNESAQNRLAA